MLTQYVLRGMKAGTVAGIVFGLFVALVGNPLIAYAETFEGGGHHGGGPVVAGEVTTAISIAGGILLGTLLGAVVLGAVFYFFEPAVPGDGGTKSYLLAAAGFITVSGAPWLVLPPQPPGVEQALPVETRLGLYVAMMLAGAVACGLSGSLYNRLHSRYGRPLAVVSALVPFGVLLVVGTILPANPVSGPIPAGLAAVFRTIVGGGQVALWFVLASTHAWLLSRERNSGAADDNRATFTDASRPVRSD